MASSDEEGEILPDSVTNYHFINSDNSLISFSDLPLHFTNHDVIGDETLVASLLGSTDGGLQSVYKEVIGWKFELSFAIPEFYVLSKARKWIKLEKPRKSYENIVKSVLIVVRFLHSAKRNAEASRNDLLNDLIKTLSWYDVVEPLETHLKSHLLIIQSAVTRDKDLAKSKYIAVFLNEIENPGRSENFLETKVSNKSELVVSDEDMAIDDDFDDEAEAEGLFDSVCAFCDNGGEVLPCEGKCIRSFHPTIESGVDTLCESLGFESAAQYEAITTFLCDNCKHQRHQCFVCGKLGSSDKSSATEVFPCVSATCGHFYHPECVSKLLYPSDETQAKKLITEITAGESFTCPIHKCHRCSEGEDKDVHELQFAVCRRCPKSYHRKCLPRKIAFEASADKTIQQRAWDDLLPNRILMYCMKHEIIPNIWTPKRDHLLFPSVVRKRNPDGSRKEMMSERRSKALGNFKEIDTIKMPKLIETSYKPVTNGNNTLKIGKSSTIHEKKSSFDVQRSNSCTFKQPSNLVQSKSSYKDLQRERPFVPKPVKKVALSSPLKLDENMKTRMLKLFKDSASAFDLEEFIKEKKRRCSGEIYTPQIGLDKAITIGKVEASVKAAQAALKILEDGGSVNDAKAVCEPNVLTQLLRWKNKLQVYLAPFLIGARYTSFGRHFTKVDKLKEIVDRLHWYVKDGDMIVDFCCGSNDFSCFMKEKLDNTGKRCEFKNYDLITPKNTFSFERTDWFDVPLDALPDGSRLIMGLNPPFGVQAYLANKFIDHALKFKPKLLILIVPKETRRLDRKSSPYDLIWEEQDMLSGKSFYLPGSVDDKDQPLDDWNVNPPPLSLWSRPDWTTKHIAVAERFGHVKPRKSKPLEPAEIVVSNHLIEENEDCYSNLSNIITDSKYQDISTILDDVPYVVDMDLSSPVKSSNSRSEPTTFNPPLVQPSHREENPVVSSVNSGPRSSTLNPMFIQSNPQFIKPRHFEDPIIQPTPPFIQPSHHEHPLGYGPPHYANTSVQDGSAIDFSYSPSGQNAYPIHPGGAGYYGPGDYTITSTYLPYDNYGYPTYPTNTFIGTPGPTNFHQPDFTSEPNIWPPGTAPPDYGV
ncbi:protein ENHANCED DOWNY MILDEW 2-like isoform X2 [Rutidosis leptorrhynchoides]|uniref:protein ENHANCED DOWNY MILDEW 2-like isoform X2 n=1 Tax=Rutidosis leptorrhynchoides TaxID=125765 RepID=UPI003A9A1654